MVGVRGVVVPGGGERIGFAAPSPAGYVPFHDGVDGGESNTNKYSNVAVVGSVGINGGGGYFTMGERITTAAAAAAAAGKVGWGVWNGRGGALRCQH